MQPLSPALGSVQYLVLLIGQAIFSGGGLLGIPPGDRDAKLVQVAPADSFLYAEWSARTKGKEGAPGVDGFLGDPEIRAFLKEVDFFVEGMFGEGDVDPENPLFSKPGYDVFKRLLMQPGCIYVRVDRESLRKARETKGGLGQLFGPADFRDFEGALVVNCGNQADAVETDLITVLNSGEEESELTNLRHHAIPATHAGLEFFLHRHENYLILGIGRESSRKVVARLEAKTPGIDGNSRFSTALQAVPEGRRGSVAWVDVESLLKDCREHLGPPGVIAAALMETVGLGSVRSLTTSTVLVEGEIRSRIHVDSDGKVEGVLSLLGGRAIAPSDLKHIPADADFVWAVSVPAGRILVAAKEIARRADPAALKLLEEGLKHWEEDSGINPDAAAAAMGEIWTLHNAPSQGSLLLSGGILSVEVRDPAKARELVDRIQSLVARMMVPEDSDGENIPHFTEEEFLGRKISYLVAEGSGGTITPAFCLTDQHLCIALNPQVLKAMVRGLKGDRPRFDLHWKNFGPLPEGDPISIYWVDSKAWAKTVSAILPYWAKEVSDVVFFSGNTFNLFHIPSVEALATYATPAVGSVVRTKNGFLWDDRGGLPMPGGATLVWKVLLWMQEPEEIGDF